MEHFLEEKYAWANKGKKYRAKYLKNVNLLFGSKSNDKDCQAEGVNGAVGTDQICDVAQETGNKVSP